MIRFRTMTFTLEELDLLLSATALAASRREAQARSVKHGRHHDIEATKLRLLRSRLFLVRLKKDAAA